MKNLTFLFCLIAASVVAQSGLPTGPKVKLNTLSWTPSPSVGVTGHWLYYGLASSNYSAQVGIPFVAGVTNFNLLNLSLPQGVYFMVLSVTNAIGDESPPSNQITWTNLFPQAPSALSVK